MASGHSISDLAIFGGPPAFGETLHVGRPNIGNRQRLIERIDDLLDRRWLTNDGPYVNEFEKRVADYVGAKHCIAMCNGTVALEIATRALDLSGEVIVPSFSFIATAHALQWQGITPVFCDIDPKTHNIDPQKIEQAITPQTTGIIGVHVWGRGCDVEALSDIARRHRLRLIFDAAHAFGCSYKGKMIGGFGEAEVFSFHATKFFNTFEGGAVVTNNDELAAKIRLMKNYGFAGYDNVVYIGTNGKMSEVSAAMGLTSFESLDEFVAVNRRNYGVYQKCLRSVRGVTMVPHNEAERCNYQYIVLEIDEDDAGISRDEIVEILWAENVRARRYFYPGCHRMQPYRSSFPHAGLNLPSTERLCQRVMLLPTGTSVSEEQVQMLCRLIEFVIENAMGVRRRLTQSAGVMSA